jgi:hypothetical protein
VHRCRIVLEAAAFRDALRQPHQANIQNRYSDGQDIHGGCGMLTGLTVGVRRGQPVTLHKESSFAYRYPRTTDETLIPNEFLSHFTDMPAFEFQLRWFQIQVVTARPARPMPQQ